MRGFLLACEVKAVRQNQPALGIGVIDHDRLAVLRIKDVARPLRIRIGKILGGRDNARHMDIRLQFADRLHRIQHSSAAGHISFHLPHFVRRLDRNPAGIERHTFADECEMAFRPFRSIG